MNIDPEILLGLQNYKQNRSSLELQREILAMQKLQVLNQARKSQGLAPIAELPPPPPKPENTYWKENPVLASVLFIILASPVLFFVFYFLYRLFVFLFLQK